MAYEREGNPYRVRILGNAMCMQCDKTIAKGRPAIGVRHGHSFFYYHISHWPKSQEYRRMHGALRKGKR